MFKLPRPRLIGLFALLLLSPLTAHAQMTMVESGFVCVLLNNDVGKQIEIGVGPDTCLYYGSFEGLKRRCGPSDPGTICDPTLTFPVGIAFSTGGSFLNRMYVADYGVGDIHRSTGCSASTVFATLLGPGALAFPPSGSAYGDFLYACQAFDGPIYRVSSTGVVTSWLDLEATYLRFGPGGAWGTGLYSTKQDAPGSSGIVKVSSAAVVTPLVTTLDTPEGFDWGFDGDMFATDVATGEIYRVKSNGTKTLFANLFGAADLAYRPGEQALYVVSNQGGLWRVTRSGTTDVSGVPTTEIALAVSPNPARLGCTLRFTQPVGGLSRGQIVDAAGRLVRRLPEAWRPAGEYTLHWDGSDESGARARAGIYFARVTAAGQTRNARVTIVH